MSIQLKCISVTKDEFLSVIRAHKSTAGCKGANVVYDHGSDISNWFVGNLAIGATRGCISFTNDYYLYVINPSQHYYDLFFTVCSSALRDKDFMSLVNRVLIPERKF